MNTKEFKQEQPPINIGADISVRSFEMIEEELKDYPKAQDFDKNEIEVISRLIHTSACFEQVLNNICFTQDAIPRIQKLLKNKAKIIVDVNMIKVGLSQFYLDTYGNEVVCYINEKFTYDEANKNKGDKKIDILLDTKISKIEKIDKGYRVISDKGKK